MNEALMLAGDLIAGVLLGLLLRRTLVDHSDAFPIGMVRCLVRRKSSTPNGRRRHRVLPRVSWRLAEVGGLPGRLLTCAHCRNAPHRSSARQKRADPARRWTMILPSVHITSDQQILWQNGLSSSTEPS